MEPAEEYLLNIGCVAHLYCKALISKILICKLLWYYQLSLAVTNSTL